MDGGADQFRHADQAAMRTDRLVQEEWPRPAGDVSGEAGAHRGAGWLDLGRVHEIRRASEEGWSHLRLRAWAAIPIPMPSICTAPCSTRYGATMFDAKGNITLDTPEMTQCLEYVQKLVKFYPDDAVSLRRCLEQPGVDLRQERADLQPAVGLGGGEARCAGRGEGLLDFLARRRAPRDGSCRRRRSSGASASSARTSRRARS